MYQYRFPCVYDAVLFFIRYIYYFKESKDVDVGAIVFAVVCTNKQIVLVMEYVYLDVRHLAAQIDHTNLILHSFIF